MPALIRAPVDPRLAYRWAGVLIAAALGHFILTMRERHRAELAGWMDSLRTSHQELADALARSATIMTERELAERRLREGEEMLRKVFDAAPDNIAITRMSDGATLEVNREFLKTGYTREEVLGVATVKPGPLGPAASAQLVRELRAHGTVRNFETELRNKDGRLVPSLVSATMVEFGGEQCVISMARDISELKRTERELRAAREALAAEVRELEASQARLRDEVAERTLAQTAPGGERGDAAQDIRDQPRLDRDQSPDATDASSPSTTNSCASRATAARRCWRRPVRSSRAFANRRGCAK